MESLREIVHDEVMDCLAEFFDEDEKCQGPETCSDVEELRQEVLESIRGIRVTLQDQKAVIRDLEKENCYT